MNYDDARERTNLVQWCDVCVPKFYVYIYISPLLFMKEIPVQSTNKTCDESKKKAKKTRKSNIFCLFLRFGLVRNYIQKAAAFLLQWNLIKN